MLSIKIRQWDTAVEARKGTILETALKHNVPYPHACRSGKCGSCKTQILSGDVEMRPYYKEVLSDAEREQGIVLACCALPKTDLEIAWLDEDAASPELPVRQLRATVTGLERPAPEVTRLLLLPEGGAALAFVAGQFVRLRFGRLPARSYSMASRPDQVTLEFHIRHVPGGAVSDHLAWQLALGDTIRLEGPFGTSYLRERHSGPIVAVAGGTGLAPMLSIVRTALRRLPARQVTLYAGARSDADLYALQALHDLEAAYPRFSCHVVLSRPPAASDATTACRIGHPHEALAQDFTDLDGAKVYCAGPPPMIEAVTRTVAGLGLAPTDLHSDAFLPSAGDATAMDRLLNGLAELFQRGRPARAPAAISSANAASGT